MSQYKYVQTAAVTLDTQSWTCIIVTTSVKHLSSLDNGPWKLFAKNQVHVTSWLLLGEAGKKKLFERSNFIPRGETVNSAAARWTDWEKLLKKEARVSQPWYCHSSWWCDAPLSPDDQIMDFQAVWMKGAATFTTQSVPGFSDFKFWASQKAFADGFGVQFTELHSVMFQRTWILISTTVRTLNFAF